MKKNPHCPVPARTIAPTAAFLLAHPCLTLRQPHAIFVFTLGKDMENRRWMTKHRGPLLIHAGKAYPNKELRARVTADERYAEYDFDGLDYGAVIGVVDVVDCVSESDSGWFAGPFGFVLANPRRFREPIPMKGRLGMFRLKPSDLPRSLR